jgi:ABC-type lipoprotein export system ATPase subunit
MRDRVAGSLPEAPPCGPPLDGGPLVRADGLRKTYGQGEAQVHAVSEATFEIRAGDQVALIGASGSGKSTLIHLIAGLERPSAGTIEWPAIGMIDHLRPGPVSLSFQGPSLLPPLTVLENVELPLLLAGSSEEAARREARHVIDRLELGTVADKLPEELSGGQSQRASVARALVGAPRLVLADEPTGQQDRASGHRVLAEMLDVAHEKGSALVIATHDPTIAERLTHRWSMRDGRLENGVVVRSS